MAMNCMLINSKRLFAYSCLQITNRCVHTVSTQELADYRESLKRFVPRSYQVIQLTLMP